MWTLTCSLPFLTCALFAYLLGWLGILGAAPSQAVLPSALPFGGTAATAVVAVGLTFALSWLLWGSLVRRLGWGRRPDPEVAGRLDAARAGRGRGARLARQPVHRPAAAAGPARVAAARGPGARPGRLASLGLVALGLLALALLVVFYADQLASAWAGSRGRRFS